MTLGPMSLVVCVPREVRPARAKLVGPVVIASRFTDFVRDAGEKPHTVIARGSSKSEAPKRSSAGLVVVARGAERRCGLAAPGPPRASPLERATMESCGSLLGLVERSFAQRSCDSRSKSRRMRPTSAPGPAPSSAKPQPPENALKWAVLEEVSQQSVHGPTSVTGKRNPTSSSRVGSRTSSVTRERNPIPSSRGARRRAKLRSDPRQAW
jgi:hypothetical protein